MAERLSYYSWSVSSASNPSNIETTFAVARQLSNEDRPFHVLVYPFKDSLGFGLRQAAQIYGYDPQPVTVADTMKAVEKYGIQVSSVHGEFDYNEADKHEQVNRHSKWFTRQREDRVWPQVLGYAESGHALDFTLRLRDEQMKRRQGNDPIAPSIGYHLNIFAHMSDALAARLEKSGLQLMVETTGYVSDREGTPPEELALQFLERFPNGEIIFAADHHPEEQKPIYENRVFIDRVAMVHVDHSGVALAAQGDKRNRDLYGPIAQGVLLPGTELVLEHRNPRFNKLSVAKQADEHRKVIEFFRVPERIAA